ncbi:50S ribosomal protein L28 [Chlamydiales bacterium]|nr:50S ribosomal protein L28 [Chlamydiales bacterium]
MGRVCQVTGKKPTSGRKYTIRGIAKKKKGIGLKITSVNKRDFKPNLKKKRLWFDDESRFVSLRLSMHALRIIDKKGLSTVIRDMRAKGQKV